MGTCAIHVVCVQFFTHLFVRVCVCVGVGVGVGVCVCVYVHDTSWYLVCDNSHLA